MEETRIEKIKNHLKKHKTTYITGGVCFIAGAVLYKVMNDATNISIEGSQNNSQTGFINYWFNHSTVIEMPATGHRGEIVFCEETKTLYPSQNAAAKELGINQANISQCLRGIKSHYQGLHFHSVGENLNEEVAIGP